VRLRVSESPIFAFMKRAGEEIRLPLIRLFKRAWKQILIVALTTLFTNVMGFIGLIFMLRYATTSLGMTRSTILTFTIIANLIEIPATLYFGVVEEVDPRVAFMRLQVHTPGTAGARWAAM
jgi:hypothetical protein